MRVTRSGICGSDLHLPHGLVPATRIGSTFGHEVTGVVEEIGPPQVLEEWLVGRTVARPAATSSGRTGRPTHD